LADSGVFERSIFGTDDWDSIWRQVLEICPEAEESFAFEVSIGARFGLRLRDGSRIALKVHPDRFDEAYLHAVQRVQAQLVAGGFPCPRPLGVRGRATLEEWVDAGEYRDAHDAAVRRVMAEYLARLVELATELRPLDGMEPYHPVEPPLWPVPHWPIFDFEATTAGAEWIDEIATQARAIRDANAARIVIGHGDWSVKHFRFDGLKPTVIYDWDSLNADFEAVFVGGAASSFTYTENPDVERWPSVEETQAFLDAYEAARGAPFTLEELRATRAAIVYARAYSTRCAHAVAGDTRHFCLRELAAVLLP
jgi:hypothetical protein